MITTITRVYLILLACLSVVFSSTHTSMNGGLSVYTSEPNVYVKGNEIEWYPGFNLEFIIFGKPTKYVGFGLGVLYTRWGADIPKTVTDSLRVALHYWRAPLIVRWFIPLEEKVSLFIDVGDGVSFGMRKFNNSYGQDKTDGLVDNGLLAGGGVLIKNVEIKSLFNVLFDKPVPIKWISFSIGYHY